MDERCQTVHVGLVPKAVLLQDAGTPSEVTLLAAFHAFLARTNNQEVTSIVLHSPNSPTLTVPCPTLENSATILTHARKVQEAVLSLKAHAASSPVPQLCQACVVVEDADAAREWAASCGLGLAILLQANNSTIDLVYRKSSFAQEAATLIARHLMVFLSGVTCSDSTSAPPALLHSPLMDAAEKQLVLKDYNLHNHTAYDTASMVHGMFAGHAQSRPDSPCVVFEDYTFTYAEVDAAANRIAHYLRNQAGVVPGDIVAVLCLRSPLMVAALLGVFKAGAGYLPLDHHHPEARIEFMLEDAAVKAIVTQPDLLHKLHNAKGIHTLLLHPHRALPQTAETPSTPIQANISTESFGAAGAESPVWQLGQLGSPKNTCYIIYTSGSTGKPKGVVVMHQGLTAYTAWFRAHFGIAASDVLLQKTPTNFDASVDELWCSLTAGATLVVAPPETHRDVDSVMRLITRHSVTTVSAVPSQVHLLAHEILSRHSAAEAAAGKAPCASLRRVLSGGEALTTAMARDIHAALPHCELHNTYGPTETTVGITSWLYTPPRDKDECTETLSSVPIGRGIHNSRMYVLDAYLQPVPVGVPGQLFISGPQVAAGYLNRPDLTDDVFLPNPFCEGPGTNTDKMYRTGDLVRWLPGKHVCLGFLGRVDHQVKLRGFRIELQEVEAALGALPGVRQVVTALAKNPATDQDHLVAWVSPKDLDPQVLLQQLQDTLPEYMIPTVVVRLQQLPLLVSEKVDRKALPAPDFVSDAVSLVPAGAGAGRALDSLLPYGDHSADPLSRFVSAVWCEVLGLQPISMVGAADDFFALGGNSLLAGKMNSTLRAGLSLPDMSGMIIYQSPTLASFVAALAEQQPLVPEWPGLADGAAASDDSGYSNYFASLRQASFSTSRSSAGQAVSRSQSFNSSRPSSFLIPNGGPTAKARMGSASAAAQPSDVPVLTTVFSQEGADLDSSPSRGLLKQLSRSLSKALSLKDQELDRALGALPVALVPAPERTPGKADQDRPISRANSTTGTPQAQQLPYAEGPRDVQVKPSLLLTTLVQLMCLCCITGMSAVLGFAPYLISLYIMLESGWRALVLLPVFELGAWLLLALWAIGGKWLVMGRYKECQVPLWGSDYLRHWIAHLFVLSARQSFVPLVRRTTLLNWFYRALGVRIGRNVIIDTDDLVGFDVLELRDDCILDAACGVSAITFTAGSPADKYPHGTMTVKAVVLGDRTVVGPHAMVTSGHVAADSVVLPCSATSNPPGLWSGASQPTTGAAARSAVNTQGTALGALSGLAAMWMTSLFIAIMAYPAVVGYFYFFQWLARSVTAESSAPSFEGLGVSTLLGCWIPSNRATDNANCTHLLHATLLALLVLPIIFLISGQLLVVLVIPFKWLLMGKVKVSSADTSEVGTVPKTWWRRFRHHLWQCMLEHPAVRSAAFLWTGTALFNAWLRALGAKVGKQVWIGEDLHLTHHDLVAVGDAVSICSGVSLLPSAALGAAKINIMDGADVTNQTALYPGVTVKPGAVLGVFTYAEAGRIFPRHSITQGPMVLSPGQPDPVGTPPRKPSAAASTPTKSPTGAHDAQHTASKPAHGSPEHAAATPSSTLSKPLKPPRPTPTVGAVYKTAVAGVDEPEPSAARLVPWSKYACFNILYITLMAVIMPVTAVLLSAPFTLITVVLLFQLGWWPALLLTPAASGLQLAVNVVTMSVLKGILLPRCQGTHPFYSYTHTAWMVDGLMLYYQQVGFLRYLNGSQLAVWYYRALGARIGKGVLLNGLQSQEPDCLTIGDGTVIDEMTFVMAHTVENRHLKFHDVTIGSGVTIGCGSCVLPGCWIGDGATMGDVSLLMKGEVMPPGSVWKGVPAVPCIGRAVSRVKA